MTGSKGHSPRKSVQFNKNLEDGEARIGMQAFSVLGHHRSDSSYSTVRLDRSNRNSTESDAHLFVNYKRVSFDLNELNEKRMYDYESVTASESESMADPKVSKTANEFAGIEWHTLPANELCRRLATSSMLGLTSDWAKKKLEENGKNVPAKPPSQLFRKFITYCFGGFGLILFLCAIMVFIAYKPLGGDDPDPAYLALGIAITIVFFLQAAFNGLQDWSSSRVMASITGVLPDRCTVLRDGQRMEIDACDLVIGDVVYVKSGNKIPADLRFIEVSSDSKFDRAILTGESEPISGTTDSTDDNYLETKCIGLQGTHCVSGTATGVVVSTGDKTVFGRIAKLTGSPSTVMTPIQKDIYQFTIIISTIMVVMVLAVLITWAAWLRKEHHGWLPPPALVVACVSIAVAFIPEGLPVAMTSTLTITANMMRKNKVLCKTLSTVETLGSVSVICSDKTGTLTKNQMFVTECSHGTSKLLTEGAVELYQTQLGFNYGKSQSAINQLRSLACLCNAADFDANDMEKPLRERIIFGDATDQAILRFSEGFSSVERMRSYWKTEFQIAFNSTNKFMIKVLKKDNEEGLEAVLPLAEAETFRNEDLLLTIKGAPDVLIGRCDFYVDENGDTRPLDSGTLNLLEDLKNGWSSEGKRVILLARKILQPEYLSTQSPSQGFETEILGQATGGLTLVGMVALVDPPRDEIPEVVRVLRGAGIRVFMVTGDFKLTAQAIAAECGIITNPPHAVCDVSALEPFRYSTDSDSIGGLPPLREMKAQEMSSSIVLSGPELNGLNETQWDQLCNFEEIVFARTTPEQKLKIVKELQKRDVIVGMTGDGVNDAPSLKAADVGIAMGNGSDVALAAADMVLLESFGAIVEAVKLGRLVYDNLKKTIAYLLPAGSYSEFWPIMTHVFFGLPQILSSFLMIVICCLTDCINAITLAYEKPEADVLLRPPRNIKKDRLVNGKLLLYSFCWVGTVECISSFAVSYWFLQRNGLEFADMFMKFGKVPDGFTKEEVKALVNTASSVYFVNLVIMQIFNLLSTRTRTLSLLQQPPLFRASTSNWRIFPAMVFSLVMIFLFLYPPPIQKVIHSTGIPVEYFFIPIGFGMFMLLVEEGRKAIARKWKRSIVARLAW